MKDTKDYGRFMDKYPEVAYVQNTYQYVVPKDEDIKYTLIMFGEGGGLYYFANDGQIDSFLKREYCACVRGSKFNNINDDFIIIKGKLETNIKLKWESPLNFSIEEK